MQNSSLASLTLSFHTLLWKTAVSCGEFICNLKSGRGEKRESQRQNNSTPDFEKSIWHVRYAQLSIQKLLRDNGPCPLIKGVNPNGGRKSQDISELNSK